MIPHTKSFKRLKDEIQRIFDFAIVVCYAVPSLKMSLKELDNKEEGKSSLQFSPDYFDSRPIKIEKVRHHTKNYKEVLSRYIFLSSFSFFEAYFLDLLKEIVEFHGEASLLDKHNISRNLKILNHNFIEEKRKLQEYRVRGNIDKYKVNKTKLAAKGFIFPSSILAKHGLKLVLELIDRENIKAVEIPDIIESLLQLPLDPDKERATFHNYRETRNKIAHGRVKEVNFHLNKAIEMNNFLRDFALKIDKHVIDHLLLVEE